MLRAILYSITSKHCAVCVLCIHYIYTRPHTHTPTVIASHQPHSHTHRQSRERMAHVARRRQRQRHTAHTQRRRRRRQRRSHHHTTSAGVVVAVRRRRRRRSTPECRNSNVQFTRLLTSVLYYTHTVCGVCTHILCAGGDGCSAYICTYLERTSPAAESRV